MINRDGVLRMTSQLRHCFVSVNAKVEHRPKRYKLMMGGAFHTHRKGGAGGADDLGVGTPTHQYR